MAVYTEVADEELEAFIASYDIGALTSCKGIAEGVENSNYLVQTEAGRYILTLYEKRVARKDLPYFLALVETDAESLKAAGDLTLQAGMPAEVFLRGEERTALQYLLEPITAAMRRAGREI